jgi:hypothetical protein
LIEPHLGVLRDVLLGLAPADFADEEGHRVDDQVLGLGEEGGAKGERGRGGAGRERGCGGSGRGSV